MCAGRTRTFAHWIGLGACPRSMIDLHAATGAPAPWASGRPYTGGLLVPVRPRGMGARTFPLWTGACNIRCTRYICSTRARRRGSASSAPEVEGGEMRNAPRGDLLHTGTAAGPAAG
ncbi:unnamed protein product [Urochloa humidicola]